MGNCCIIEGRFEAARHYLRQNWQIHRQSRNRMQEGRALNALGMADFYLRDWAKNMSHVDQGLELCLRTGNRVDEGYAWWAKGETLAELGRYAAAEECFVESVRLFGRVGTLRGEGLSEASRARVAHLVGDDKTSLAHSQRAIEIGRTINSFLVLVNALTPRGDALASADEARAAYREVETLCQRMDFPHWGVRARAGLARLALAQGDPEQALRHALAILDRIRIDPRLCGTYSPLRVYLACYRVLDTVRDRRAGEVLATAYDLLQAWARQIDDLELRRSFLENVPYHREIHEIWRTH
jgi:tetratricopeptide (TPR) repeat protein